MKISDILVTDAMLLDLQSTAKQDVLREMADALAAAEAGVEAEDLFDVLVAREKLQSTGIGEAVAIPHGKMPGISKLMASFARSRAGIDFDSIDGEPTNLFFLLVVPEHSGGQHLKALARISRFFRDASFCKRLLEAETRDEVCRAIEEEDAKF